MPNQPHPRQSTWLDRDPPADFSLAAAYWCEMDYFLDHTTTGDHPPCRCPEGQGHNDPKWEAHRAAA